jgi:hypothetical protein
MSMDATRARLPRLFARQTDKFYQILSNFIFFCKKPWPVLVVATTIPSWSSAKGSSFCPWPPFLLCRTAARSSTHQQKHCKPIADDMILIGIGIIQFIATRSKLWVRTCLVFTRTSPDWRTSTSLAAWAKRLKPHHPTLSLILKQPRSNKRTSACLESRMLSIDSYEHVPIVVLIRLISNPITRWPRATRRNDLRREAAKRLI